MGFRPWAGTAWSVICVLLAVSPLAEASAATGGLAAAYAELGAAYLDDPPYPDQLAGCVDDKNYDCLLVYETKRAAVRKIFESGRDEALRRTLAAVREHCTEAGPTRRGRDGVAPWQTCAGAVSAIYFFYKPMEDQAIREALAKMPERTITHIFIDAQGEQAWCYNRPDAELWVQLLESWSFLQKYRKDYQDAGWLEHIFEQAVNHKGEVQPILMYDPEFQLDGKLAERVRGTLRRRPEYEARLREKVRRFGMGG